MTTVAFVECLRYHSSRLHQPSVEIEPVEHAHCEGDIVVEFVEAACHGHVLRCF